MADINMTATSEDEAVIGRIADRAYRMKRAHGLASRPAVHIEMDVTAVHLNGCPLRLTDMLAGSDFDFAHDIDGFDRHLDRYTGQLGGEFLPRFAR